MDERPAQIEIVLAAAEEQHRSNPVDDNARSRDRHHRAASDGLRVEKALHRLAANRANRGNQQCGIGQRRQNRGAFEAIGKPRRGWAAGQHRGGPSDDQAQHVRQIVPGIRHQRHRSRDDAIACLDHDKRCVKRDTDGKSAAIIAGCVPVMMAVIVPVMMVVRAQCSTPLTDTVANMPHCGKIRHFP